MNFDWQGREGDYADIRQVKDQLTTKSSHKPIFAVIFPELMFNPFLQMVR